MTNILNILQIVISILLIISILLQQRGAGLGGAFGGESSVYRSKRGIEKTLYNITIILAIIFVITSVVNVIL
jgi:preprotein translocase subunit SecG